MKDYIRQVIHEVRGTLRKTCLVREYLQARVLQTLQEDGAFERWAFVGGTALRFLYSLQRFSEDLDFSTVDALPDPGFRPALRKIHRAFAPEGYELSIKVDDRKTVAAAMLRFPGLAYELGLSPHAAQVLSIKVELDTNPPSGAGLETTLVRRHVALNLQHHDKPSLLAGKLHALLSRPWLKGRDVYDLIWYLADPAWPEPNLTLLNSALRQTGWTGSEMTPGTWRTTLEARLETLDWDQARGDVQPFLEHPQESELITLDNALRLLRGKK